MSDEEPEISPIGESSLDEVFEDMERVRDQCYIDGQHVVVRKDSGYDLPLFKMDTPEKLLGVVLSLLRKGFVDRALLSRFIVVAAKANNINIEEP